MNSRAAFVALDVSRTARVRDSLAPRAAACPARPCSQESVKELEDSAYRKRKATLGASRRRNIWRKEEEKEEKAKI